MEAIVPTEIGMPMLRNDLPEQSNTETVINYLDTIDELREAAAMRITSYHSRLENLYVCYVSAEGLSPTKSFQKYNRSISRKIPTKLGRTIYYITVRRIRIVCFKQTRRGTCTQNVECYASQKVLSIKNDSISNFVPIPSIYNKVQIRLMSYRPSMVDAQLVHYKVRRRLMSCRPSMVDA